MSDPIDTKLRELTYRMIEMAPEAPPYPEVDLVRLRPTHDPEGQPQRKNPLVWAAAAAALALVLVGVPLGLFGPGDETDPNRAVIEAVPPPDANSAGKSIVRDVVREEVDDVVAAHRGGLHSLWDIRRRGLVGWTRSPG
jgi:hypothetical protein